jgi:hypothetical protein
MFSIKTFAIGVLIAANLFVPRVLHADCCKYCGAGTTLYETTRSDGACSLYCTVEQCSIQQVGSTNCDGGNFPCSDAFNDQCNSYVFCEG